MTHVACSREDTRAQPTPESLDKDHALCGTEMTRSQRELLFGLEQVVRRIYEPTIIRYLSANEVSEILQVGGQYLARAKREQRQLEAGSVWVNPC